jgi:hypothetical protein
MAELVPFALPADTRARLATIFPPGLPIMAAAESGLAHGLTMADIRQGAVLLRHQTRAYVRLAVTPAGLVAGHEPVEGDVAAQLDRELWFRFRGLRDKVAVELTIGAPVRAVIAALRALAPIGFDHLTSVYRRDLGSVRMYHLVGGGVIGLEVDAGGTVTGANLLPPMIGQTTVLAIEAQDRAAPVAPGEPLRVRDVRAALDDVVRRRAEIIGVRELDADGTSLEVTARTGGRTTRHRYLLDAEPAVRDSGPVTENFAYRFQSDLTLGAMLAKLNELGPWQWVLADNDRWGDYLATSKVIEGAQRSLVKIIRDTSLPGRAFAVDVLVRSDQPDVATRLAGVRTTLFDRLLPAIGARDLAETDGYE